MGGNLTGRNLFYVESCQQRLSLSRFLRPAGGLSMALRRGDGGTDGGWRRLQQLDQGAPTARERRAADWAPLGGISEPRAGAFERRLEAVRARRQADDGDGDLPRDPFDTVRTRKFSFWVMV